MKHLIHTPEGFRDIFGRECDKKRFIERKIEKKFRSFGYQSIETPSLEFSDAFSRDVGSVPVNEMYKLFDRDGNMLVLRPDFTPSVARSVSMYFMEEQGPLRFCYHGNVFQNNLHYQGHLHENTQMGVELIGEDSPEADAEIIALVVEALRESGLTEFQVSIGHVDYFQSLAETAGLDEDTQADLRNLLLTRNRFGAEEQIRRLRLRKDLQTAFESIPELFGNRDVLSRAKSLTDNRRAIRACERLEKIYETLDAYGCGNYVTFDMGLLSPYRYYTGIIFQAYTYGTGDSIIKGGRYDALLERYGKKAPAIGFTTEIGSLLTALDRQGIQVPIHDIKTMILYPSSMESGCVRYAQRQRAKGLDVACVRFEPGRVLDDYRAYGVRNQFGGIVYFKSETEVYAINLGTGEVDQINVAGGDEKI
ncbi:MAG: ATP phosphoribosyltransferase regulatory subunit [Bilifractor sp.]|jgi:ATP phosphoribosyltransferase regulatory subunit